MLDRLVGYKVSPLLWDKVRRGLSAGRVQTVAVRLVVEREREIQAFVKTEYWTITAALSAALPPAFDARLYRIAERTVKTSGFDAGVKKSEVHIENEEQALDRAMPDRKNKGGAAAEAALAMIALRKKLGA